MRLSRRQFIGLIGAAGLSSCAGTKRALGKITPDIHLGGNGPLCFVALNDLHVLDAKSTGIVNRAVKQINADKDVDFVAVLGDIATDGKIGELKLAKGSLDRLEKPYFCVPGNHDIEARALDPCGSYRGTFGELQWTEGEEGWLFMGIDTCNGTASDVTVPQERMDWIAKQLKHTKKGRPIAVFCHHPFNPNSKAYRVQNADDVLALFAEHNLKLVAAGHYHGNQAEVRDGVLFTTTACCASTRGNFDNTEAKGYRRFRMDKQEIGHEFVEVAA